MNRKNLTAAVLAGLAGAVGIAGSAQAVNVNPDGTGQVLLYPYYTTNAGNVTLLSIVNTTEKGKAVKVRFLESENSQEVLDFNLYMSPFDVWTAAITPIGDFDSNDCDPNLNDDTVILCSGPLLKISPDETTCTVPILNGAQAFLPFKFSSDGGTQSQARMNEGHIEVLEMGTLIPHEWAADAALHGLHNGEWQPADCQALVTAWTGSTDGMTDGRWITDPTDGVTAPSGGLFGGASIVNVGGGAMHSYDATALNGWNNSGFEFGDPAFTDSIHAQPGFTKPNLASTDQATGFVFSDTGTSISSGALTGSGEAPIDAVSYVLMHDALMNEYTTENAVAGQTEWVITFPTKRFYVDSSAASRIVPVRPFTKAFAPVSEGDFSTACEAVELRTIWDRDERVESENCASTNTCAADLPPSVSPAPPRPPNLMGKTPFELCFETNVIRFGAAGDNGSELPMATEILGSPMPNYRNIDNVALGFKNGWAKIELDDFITTTGSPSTGFSSVNNTRTPIGSGATGLNGLPVIGFSVERFSNGFLGETGAQVMSSYGALFNHKYSRKLGSGSAGPL